MTAAPEVAAARRVMTFVSARDAHRERINRAFLMMGGGRRNPLPALIMAEYGTLDVDDVRLVCSHVLGVQP